MMTYTAPEVYRCNECGWSAINPAAAHDRACRAWYAGALAASPAAAQARDALEHAVSLPPGEIWTSAINGLRDGLAGLLAAVDKAAQGVAP